MLIFIIFLVYGTKVCWQLSVTERSQYYADTVRGGRKYRLLLFAAERLCAHLLSRTILIFISVRTVGMMEAIAAGAEINSRSLDEHLLSALHCACRGVSIDFSVWCTRFF